MKGFIAWFNNTYWFVKILIIAVTFFLFPSLVQWGFEQFTPKSITASPGWLGFLGGYLGSVLSISFAYFNTKWQMDNERKRQQVEKIEQLLPHFYIDCLKLSQSTTSISSAKARPSYKDCQWTAEVRYGILSQSGVLIENTDLYFYGIDEVSPKHLSVGHMTQEAEERQVGVRIKESDLVSYGMLPGEAEYAINHEPSTDDCFWPSRLDIICKTAVGNKVYMTYGQGVDGTSFYQDDLGDWHRYSGPASEGASNRLNEYKQRLELQQTAENEKAQIKKELQKRNN